MNCHPEEVEAVVLDCDGDVFVTVGGPPAQRDAVSEALPLRVMNVIVMHAVVNGVLELNSGVTPTREFVVVHLDSVIALNQDTDGGIDAVTTIVPVVLDTLVGVLGRALSTVSAGNSESWSDIHDMLCIDSFLKTSNLP